MKSNKKEIVVHFVNGKELRIKDIRNPELVVKLVLEDAGKGSMRIGYNLIMMEQVTYIETF